MAKVIELDIENLSPGQQFDLIKGVLKLIGKIKEEVNYDIAYYWENTPEDSKALLAMQGWLKAALELEASAIRQAKLFKVVF